MAAKETKESGTARPETGMTDGEVQVSRRLQGDIPLDSRPFRRIAEETGLTEREVLAIAGRLRKRGIIRRFGAVVRHQLAGYTHNVMVLWAVAPESCRAAGRRLASFPEITHCYERNPPFSGRYNLFTMVHFRGKPDDERLRKMAAAAGTDDFRVLSSLEEFKKTSMGYF